MKLPYPTKVWNRKEIIFYVKFIVTVATNILINQDLQIIDECRQRPDWPQQKKMIQVQLASLAKHKVFGLIVEVHKNVKLMGTNYYLYGSIMDII